MKIQMHLAHTHRLNKDKEKKIANGIKFHIQKVNSTT